MGKSQQSSKLPGRTIRDHAHVGVRATLSAIPLLGGPAVELFNHLLAPPIDRRRNEWLEGLASRIEELHAQHRLSVDTLSSDEQFVSTMMQASHAALRSHQKEKIEALRNAVLNTAMGLIPDNSRRELFLSLVADFTVLHLHILQTLNRSDGNAASRSRIEVEPARIAEKAIDLDYKLRGQKELVEIAVEDLCNRQLLFWNRGSTVTTISLDATQVSQLGREFLAFITDPTMTE